MAGARLWAEALGWAQHVLRTARNSPGAANGQQGWGLLLQKEATEPGFSPTLSTSRVGYQKGGMEQVTVRVPKDRDRPEQRVESIHARPDIQTSGTQDPVSS